VKYTPPFLAAFAGNNFSSPTADQRLPRLGFESDAKITYDLPDSSWELSAAIRYGRAHNSRESHDEGPSPPSYFSAFGVYQHAAPAKRYQDVTVADRESYGIADFTAGKDVGLGLLGDGNSKIDFGLRAVQFSRNSQIGISGNPDFAIAYKYLHFGPRTFKIPELSWHIDNGQASAQRSFRGFGPLLAWEGTKPAFGSADTGEITIDWGLNGALLFGKQKAQLHLHTKALYHSKLIHNSYPLPVSYDRSSPNIHARTIVVPNVGAFAGLSFRYANAKVSFGYRADMFFNAIDGGIDTRKNENRSFFGPFASVSIGVGD
jgi:iron complex outermembrane recepter protein